MLAGLHPAETQGMARRTAMDFLPLRLADGEPRRACSSSATGVACVEVSEGSGLSTMCLR